MKRPDDFPQDLRKAVSVAWKQVRIALTGEYPEQCLAPLSQHRFNSGYDIAKALEQFGARPESKDIMVLERLMAHIESALQRQVYDWLHLYPNKRPQLQVNQLVCFTSIRQSSHMVANMLPNIGAQPLVGKVTEVSFMKLDQARVSVQGYSYVVPWWDGDQEKGLEPLSSTWGNQSIPPATVIADLTSTHRH